MISKNRSSISNNHYSNFKPAISHFRILSNGPIIGSTGKVLHLKIVNSSTKNGVRSVTGLTADMQLNATKIKTERRCVVCLSVPGIIPICSPTNPISRSLIFLSLYHGKRIKSHVRKFTVVRYYTFCTEA